MSEESVCLRIGGILSGQSFVLDSSFLKYKGPYGKTFTVSRSQIEAVAVDTLGRGKGILKIIGKGTTLASITLPVPWAEKAMEWLHEQLGL